MANKYNNDMTDKDIEFLKENYNSMSVSEISEKLNKSKATIYKHITSNNLQFINREGKPWNTEEINFLKSNYKIMSYEDIALKLKRTKKSVQGKCYGLKLVKSPQSKNWSKEEIEYLKTHVNSETYAEISKHINRSISAIYTKVWELHLIPDELKGCRKLKKEQVDFIIANCDRMTDSQLAAKFQASIEAVSAVRKKYGIKKTGNEVTGPTYIEQFIIDLLDEYKIEYIYNEKLGPYLPDFQIKDTKIILEVQGDYFHCNPFVYPDGPEDEIQIRHVLKDYYKKCYFLSRGYEIIEIWELDINKNSKKVKNIIENISAVYRQNSQKSIDN